MKVTHSHAAYVPPMTIKDMHIGQMFRFFADGVIYFKVKDFSASRYYRIIGFGPKNGAQMEPNFIDTMVIIPVQDGSIITLTQE